jgi:hypothetical protein
MDQSWPLTGLFPKSDVLGEGKQALPTMSLNANVAANIGMLARVET